MIGESRARLLGLLAIGPDDDDVYVGCGIGNRAVEARIGGAVAGVDIAPR